jgi:hypothetical protein
VGDFLVPTQEPLTNLLDAVLLPRVLRWVAVVFRQNRPCGQLDPDGRPWTRIPAKDLAAQLEREDGVQVSVRRIQRSLERLAEAGYLERRQRTKWWGQRDYWYSWTDQEWGLQQHRPTAVGRSSSVSPQREPQCRSEASTPAVHILNLPSTHQHSSRGGQKVAPRLDQGSAVSTARGTHKGQQPLETLQRVVQRAVARGFGHQPPKLAAAAQSVQAENPLAVTAQTAQQAGFLR